MAYRVLIVDDSKLVLAQLRLFLEQEGFVVREATDGEEGLARVREDKPDFILCDLNMPRMGGLEMVKQLRNNGDKTPCFVLSTEMSSELIAQGREVGVLAWMLKPFKPDALLKGINRVLGTA